MALYFSTAEPAEYNPLYFCNKSKLAEIGLVISEILEYKICQFEGFC